MSWRILQGDVLDHLRELPAESVQCCVTSPPYWGLRDYGVAGQIGMEPTPDEHVAKLVEVFREVRRVLREDGVLWLNYGDAYATTGMPSLKPKDLIGLAWMLAFALRADGWWLRSDCIWHKPNPMPESIRDRPTKAHEYVFLMSKSARYFYDADAIKETATGQACGNTRPTKGVMEDSVRHRSRGGLHRIAAAESRNLRTVWTVTTEPYPEAHFATFPEALAERCIKTGTSAHGACSKCLSPWERVTEVTYENPGNRSSNGPRSTERRHETAGFAKRMERRSETTGWQPTCDCGADVTPCVVLDPFAGSGTTLAVAERLGRDSLGIELNPAYIAMAERRIRSVDPTQPIPLKNGSVQGSLFRP